MSDLLVILATLLTVVIILFTAVAVGCIIIKVCFKIADKIFGL